MVIPIHLVLLFSEYLQRWRSQHLASFPGLFFPPFLSLSNSTHSNSYMQYLVKISALFSVVQYTLSIFSVYYPYILCISVYILCISLSIPLSISRYTPQYTPQYISVYPSLYLSIPLIISQYTHQYIPVYPSVYLSIPLSINLSVHFHSWYPQCIPTCTNLMASATELLV